MRSIVAALASLVLVACASSNSAPCPEEGCSGDGGGLDGGTPDATVWIDVIVPDAADLRGFGEPCTDRSQCESEICIFAGTTGVCSQLCFGGPDDCPEGWGCYGVEGAIEPGEVVDVCVPENDRLCDPCTESSQCSTVFPDLCLPQATGSFCAQDCSVVECPAGYTCSTVNVSGTDYQQCLPDSGACDCDAADMGNTVGCTIATPFGFCGGQRTCQGATGWGPCEPPSPTDVPDPTFTDDNCDGIDGDIDEGIFVSLTMGLDDAGCGLTYDDPCASINNGIARAVAEGRPHVYVQSAVYAEIVRMASGVNVWGGFDAGWQRDTRSAPGHEVRIAPTSADAATEQFVAVFAHDLGAQATLGDLVIDAPDATGTLSGNGRSSYGIHAKNALLVIERVTVLAGNGANGADGSAGMNAGTVGVTSSMDGDPGGDAHEETFACNIDDHGAGGAGGTNTCPAGSINPNGGRGGDGGEMDTSCGWTGACSDCDATNGDGGSNASTYMAGVYGYGGGGGPGLGSGCNPNGAGGDAADGIVVNGAAGGGGDGNGALSGDYWNAEAGGAGGVGAHGSGGGGGGGSGGCDDGIDSWGAGGGGGGAGGCRALSGGGGGGSFAVFAHTSTVNAIDCAITRGTGGAGGDGGTGGRGQSGGPGDQGGSASGDSAGGGWGGNGAHGGHGGGGGGGAGGISYGFFGYASSVFQSCTFVGGTAGSGGSGGVSAPTAPVGDNDGNDGAAGSGGSVGDNGTCVAPGGC
jgi:hypothetical protein